MYRSILKFGLLTIAATLLAGCVIFDDTRRLGPDEFGVVSRAPLSQPPDFALRPPRTGEKRPNEVTPREEARSQLLAATTQRGTSLASSPKDPAADGLSAGERAMLQQAGAIGVDPDIRVIVDRESGRVKEDESLVDTLVFWRGKSKEPTVIDPKAESLRLSRNAAIGAPNSQGGTSKKPAGK